MLLLAIIKFGTKIHNLGTGNYVVLCWFSIHALNRGVSSAHQHSIHDLYRVSIQYRYDKVHLALGVKH